MNNQFYINLRSIILFGFAFLMSALIYTGQIQYYIAPQMMKFMYFATGTFFILGIIQLFRSEDSEEHCLCGHDHQETKHPFIRFFVYSLFILPLLTGFVFPEKILDSSMAQKKGVSLNGSVMQKDRPAQQADSESSKSSTPNADEFLEDPEGYMEDLEEEVSDSSNSQTADDGVYDYDEYYADLADQYKNKDKVVVTDDKYSDLLDTLSIFLDQFQGKTIEIEGFAYRENDMGNDELVVARYLMSCCSADTSVVGTMAKGTDLQKIEDDQWVKVTGTIKKTNYNDSTIPMIEVTNVERIKSPDSPYVYQDVGIFN
ncbi:TIGR03943 family putative permease subunit [Pseudalkalibacillus salsuginis]|uniref:TIGR03943 family putative permease subunit n=1 Tax=Pseudalkalibacillus salsuginis TaxID=2910972 RepID=UPI001F35AD7E|nr:TIGR03943 family protein [Pseudalkalibacillus salsuginis]MCF6411216.1 TIGR03943 family protein [Pseudalkalibacillus salsuginis]